MTGEMTDVHKTPLEFLNLKSSPHHHPPHHINKHRPLTGGGGGAVVVTGVGTYPFTTVMTTASTKLDDLKQSQFETIFPTVIKSNLLDFDEERTYDDPCDLMEEWSSSPPRLPRSRSWLCCPNSISANNNNLQKLQRRISCEYSTLVTEQPTLNRKDLPTQPTTLNPNVRTV